MRDRLRDVLISARRREEARAPFLPTTTHRWVDRDLPDKLPPRGSPAWVIRVVRPVYAAVRDAGHSPEEVLRRACRAIDAVGGLPPGTASSGSEADVVRWLLVHDGAPANIAPTQTRRLRDMITGGDL